MSKLDLAYFYGRGVIGQHYLLGSEAWYRIWNYVADKLLSDCSGLMIGIWRRSNVKFFKGGQWVLYPAFFGTERPPADLIYRRCEELTVAQILPGDYGFHINKSGKATHVWIHFGHSRPAPLGDGTGYTLESGDGTGHVGWHTVKWQLSRKGYKVAWGRLPTNMGELTPVGGTFPIPDWPVMYKNYKGDTVRELKGLLNQLVPGCKMSTSNTISGKTYDAATCYWVAEFQKKHQKEYGLRTDGATTPSVVKAMQNELRKLVG